MLYERKIKYLDYLEKGQRIQGGGYVKMEAREGKLRVELAVTGLRAIDSCEQDVLFKGSGVERPVGKVSILNGRGQFKKQFHNLNDIAGSGISYESLQGVRIVLGAGREVSCSWAPREKRRRETDAVQKKSLPSGSPEGGRNPRGAMASPVTVDSQQKGMPWLRNAGEGQGNAPGTGVGLTLARGEEAGTGSGRAVGTGMGFSGALGAKVGAGEAVGTGMGYSGVWREKGEAGAGAGEVVGRDMGYSGVLGERGGAGVGAGEVVGRDMGYSGVLGERGGAGAGDVVETGLGFSGVWREKGEAEAMGSPGMGLGFSGVQAQEVEGGIMGASGQGCFGVLGQGAETGGTSGIGRGFPPVQGKKDEGEVIGFSGAQGEEAGTGGASRIGMGFSGAQGEKAEGGVGAQGMGLGFFSAREEAGGVGVTGMRRDFAQYQEREAGYEKVLGMTSLRDSDERQVTDWEVEGGRMERKREKQEGDRRGNRPGDKKVNWMEEKKGSRPGDRRSGGKQQEKAVRLLEDKWEQLWATYPHIRPFQDGREYLSIEPSDFVLFPAASYRAVNNSFLLHGYYNYHHLLLVRLEKKGEVLYYIGVPGNFFEREKQVAIMFGFESFECAEEPAQAGDFGYYMMRTQL